MKISAHYFIAIAAVLALGCISANPALYPPRRDDTRYLYLLDNHWHTGLILPTACLPNDLRKRLGSLTQGRYVALGWGDEGFFRASAITAPLAVQALFFSRGSVMQVFRIDEPETAFARNITVYRVAVSSAGLKQIVQRVDSSFQRCDGLLVDAGPSPNGGRFYFAHGQYSLLHTCNQWTADRLCDGGLPISAAFSGLASHFERQLEADSIVGVVEFRNAGRAPE